MSKIVVHPLNNSKYFNVEVSPVWTLHRRVTRTRYNHNFTHFFQRQVIYRLLHYTLKKKQEKMHKILDHKRNTTRWPQRSGVQSGVMNRRDYILLYLSDDAYF